MAKVKISEMMAAAVLMVGTGYGMAIAHHLDEMTDKTYAEIESSKLAYESAPQKETQSFESPDKSKIINYIFTYVGDLSIAREYAKYIIQYSKNMELDPVVVAGVIAQESSYQTEEVSGVGARGLMQVMPFWKKSMTEESKGRWSGFRLDNLYDPETNIKYGCRILKIYMERNKGNTRKALASYNGTAGFDQYPDKVQKRIDEISDNHRLSGSATIVASR